MTKKKLVIDVKEPNKLDIENLSVSDLRFVREACVNVLTRVNELIGELGANLHPSTPRSNRVNPNTNPINNSVGNKVQYNPQESNISFGSDDPNKLSTFATILDPMNTNEENESKYASTYEIPPENVINNEEMKQQLQTRLEKNQGSNDTEE